MNVLPIRTRILVEGEDLAAFIAEHIPQFADGSILAISSKVVALAERRVANAKDKEALIARESSWAKQILPKWWLTVRQGIAIVNAGIDESNAEGKLVLLPEDCFASAQKLYASVLHASGYKQNTRIRKFGVVITDSRIAPLRAGVTGVALGYAGFRGIRDYRGTPDIFGKTLEVTQTNVADSLATAATLVMGEGSEQQPLAIITDAPVEFVDAVNQSELRIDPAEDIYRDLFI